MRLIRGIEAYGKYVEAGDIVEATWDETKDSSDAKIASLIKSNSYKSIMLINATAQVALTHHLDDEMSKNASVNVNRHVAEQVRPKTALQQAKVAPVLLLAYLEAGRLLGTDLPMARAVAVDKVLSETGVDYRPLLAGNTAKEVPLTPTDLWKEIGVSGQKMNQLLEGSGLQTKEGDKWVPTEKGARFSSMEPYKSRHSDHTDYRPMWFKSVLGLLEAGAA